MRIRDDNSRSARESVAKNVLGLNCMHNIYRGISKVGRFQLHTASSSRYLFGRNFAVFYGISLLLPSCSDSTSLVSCTLKVADGLLGERFDDLIQLVQAYHHNETCRKRKTKATDDLELSDDAWLQKVGSISSSAIAPTRTVKNSLSWASVFCCSTWLAVVGKCSRTGIIWLLTIGYCWRR